MEYYSQKIEQVLSHLKTTKKGLSTSTALERAKAGTNKLDDTKKVSFFKKVLLQFKDFMVVILIISAMLSITLSLRLIQ